jgi:hypothetical protein
MVMPKAGRLSRAKELGRLRLDNKLCCILIDVSPLWAGEAVDVSSVFCHPHKELQVVLD